MLIKKEGVKYRGLMRNKNSQNEFVVNGSKVLVENGEVKTILNEEIQKTGYMTVEEFSQILDAYINCLEKIYKQ